MNHNLESPPLRPDPSSPEQTPAPAALEVLLDMRPALDGFYGIPQETRLLFAALAAQPGVQVSGLLQMSTRQVKGGVSGSAALTEAERIHRYSKAVVSLKGQSMADWKMGVSTQS